jgi:DNA-binding transcriptional ArsR family regulator
MLISEKMRANLGVEALSLALSAAGEPTRLRALALLAKG